MLEIQEVLYRFNKKMSQRAIAASMKLSRNTVHKIIKEGAALGLKEDNTIEEIEVIADKIREKEKTKIVRIAPVQEVLKKEHKKIEGWLLMPHMTVTQMVRLFEEEGKQVSTRSLRRYLKVHVSCAPVSTVHLETTPGKQAQVDFASAGMIEDMEGNLRKVHAFIMTLSHSRHRFVRFVFRQDVGTWIDCHKRAFHFFGGVPWTVMPDNLKAGVITPDFYDPIKNRTYGECERHYGFIIDPTKVRTPRHKGKVERSVTIVRQQILAGRTFKNIEELNTYALEWCLSGIGKKVTRTTGKAPFDMFMAEEKMFLKPLPKEDYECPTWQEGKVHRDHHVVFEGSFYSMPTRYIGKTVWVRASERMVEIFHEEKRIKAHIRTRGKGIWITDKNDYPRYAKAFLEMDEEGCLKEALSIGAETQKLIETILSPISTVTTLRKAQAILRLSATYGPHRLEAASKRALLFEALQYRNIKNILSKGLDGRNKNEEERQVVDPKGSYLRDPQEFCLNEGRAS